MSEEKSIKVELGPDQRELVLREGQADPVIPFRKSGKIEGTISVPREYLSKAPKWLTDPDMEGGDAPINFSLLVVDRDKMNIQFIEDKGMPWEQIYTGALVFDPDFEKFQINNAQHTYTPFELAEKIKMNRSLFEKKSDAMRLVSELRNFEAKVNKDVEAKKDDRANTRVLMAQSVETNLPENFKMKLPIFKGQPPVVLEIEVAIDPGDLSCRLVSPEVNDFIHETKNEIIDSEKSAIAELHPGLCIFEV